jgi:hypothetical protein
VDQTFAHYTSSSHTAGVGVGVGNCHDVEERVNEVLAMMGLEDVADTVIGKWMHVVRTVGGGALWLAFGSGVRAHSAGALRLSVVSARMCGR